MLLWLGQASRAVLLHTIWPNTGKVSSFWSRYCVLSALSTFGVFQSQQTGIQKPEDLNHHKFYAMYLVVSVFHDSTKKASLSL